MPHQDLLFIDPPKNDFYFSDDILFCNFPEQMTECASCAKKIASTSSTDDAGKQVVRPITNAVGNLNAGSVTLPQNKDGHYYMKHCCASNKLGLTEDMHIICDKCIAESQRTGDPIKIPCALGPDQAWLFEFYAKKGDVNAVEYVKQHVLGGNATFTQTLHVREILQHCTEKV